MTARRAWRTEPVRTTGADPGARSAGTGPEPGPADVEPRTPRARGALHPRTSRRTLRPLVLGIGNLLMGDEGVGVHAVGRLEREFAATPPPDASPVAIVDGGTGGFHLLSYLTDYDPVILIDATMDGQPPGTVSVLEPRYASDFPRALTAHDIGLRDLVEAAVLSGPLPTIWLVTVSIAELQAMQTTMTPAVEAAIPEALARVRRCLRAGLRGPELL